MIDKLIGIVSIIFGYLGWRSLIRKKNLFLVSSNQLFTDNSTNSFLSGLEDQKLIVSNIVFWNSGNETLLKEDLPLGSYLTLVVGDNSVIRNIVLVKQSNDLNNVRIKDFTNQNKVSIEFEYFNPKEGFVLQVIHSQNKVESLLKNMSYNVKIVGFFKGGNRIQGSISKKYLYLLNESLDDSLSLILIYIILISPFHNWIFNAISTLLFCSLLVLKVFNFHKRFRFKLPRNLSEFYE